MTRIIVSNLISGTIVIAVLIGAFALLGFSSDFIVGSCSTIAAWSILDGWDECRTYRKASVR